MNNIIRLIKLQCYLLLFTSCASTYDTDNKDVQNLDIPKFIIQKLKSDNSNFFNNTDVIIITLRDSIKNNEFIYGVYDKNYVQDIAVRPDSIKFSFKNYSEIDGKLFVWESFNLVKKPTEIYERFKKYNVRLDSCSYKYQYKINDVEKFSNCTKNRKSHFTSNEFSSIYYKAKVNIEKNKLVLKTVTRRSQR